MRERLDQVPCRYCGRHYRKRGIANHERHCGQMSGSGSNHSGSYRGQALGNAVESVTSLSSWTTNFFQTLGQTVLLFFLCGIIREVIKTGVGFVAEKGLEGSKDAIIDGLTAVETIRLQVSKQARANIRLQENPQDQEGNKHTPQAD